MHNLTALCRRRKSIKCYNGFVPNLVTMTRIYQGLCTFNYVKCSAGWYLSVQVYIVHNVTCDIVSHCNANDKGCPHWPLLSCDLPYILTTNLSSVHWSHIDNSTPVFCHPSVDSISNETLSDVIVAGIAAAFGLSAKLDEPFSCPTDWIAGTGSPALLTAAVALLALLDRCDDMGQYRSINCAALEYNVLAVDR